MKLIKLQLLIGHLENFKNKKDARRIADVLAEKCTKSIADEIQGFLSGEEMSVLLQNSEEPDELGETDLEGSKCGDSTLISASNPTYQSCNELEKSPIKIDRDFGEILSAISIPDGKESLRVFVKRRGVSSYCSSCLEKKIQTTSLQIKNPEKRKFEISAPAINKRRENSNADIAKEIRQNHIRQALHEIAGMTESFYNAKSWVGTSMWGTSRLNESVICFDRNRFKSSLQKKCGNRWRNAKKDLFKNIQEMTGSNSINSLSSLEAYYSAKINGSDRQERTCPDSNRQDYAKAQALLHSKQLVPEMVETFITLSAVQEGDDSNKLPYEVIIDNLIAASGTMFHSGNINQLHLLFGKEAPDQSNKLEIEISPVFEALINDKTFQDIRRINKGHPLVKNESAKYLNRSFSNLAKEKMLRQYLESFFKTAAKYNPNIQSMLMTKGGLTKALQEKTSLAKYFRDNRDTNEKQKIEEFAKYQKPICEEFIKRMSEIACSKDETILVNSSKQEIEIATLKLIDTKFNDKSQEDEGIDALSLVSASCQLKTESRSTVKLPPKKSPNFGFHDVIEKNFGGDSHRSKDSPYDQFLKTNTCEMITQTEKQFRCEITGQFDKSECEEDFSSISKVREIALKESQKRLEEESSKKIAEEKEKIVKSGQETANFIEKYTQDKQNEVQLVSIPAAPKNLVRLTQLQSKPTIGSPNVLPGRNNDLKDDDWGYPGAIMLDEVVLKVDRKTGISEASVAGELVSTTLDGKEIQPDSSKNILPEPTTKVVEQLPEVKTDIAFQPSKYINPFTPQTEADYNYLTSKKTYQDASETRINNYVQQIQSNPSMTDSFQEMIDKKLEETPQSEKISEVEKLIEEKRKEILAIKEKELKKLSDEKAELEKKKADQKFEEMNNKYTDMVNKYEDSLKKNEELKRKMPISSQETNIADTKKNSFNRVAVNNTGISPITARETIEDKRSNGYRQPTAVVSGKANFVAPITNPQGQKLFAGLFLNKNEPFIQSNGEKVEIGSSANGGVKKLIFTNRDGKKVEEIELTDTEAVLKALDKRNITLTKEEIDALLLPQLGADTALAELTPGKATPEQMKLEKKSAVLEITLKGLEAKLAELKTNL